jgi:carbonic anhydrase
MPGHFLVHLFSVLLGTGSGSEYRGFYFNYNHHGEDWMDGECASRDRQSPIDFGSFAPWSCNPPMAEFLRYYLGPVYFQEYYPALASGAVRAPSPGPSHIPNVASSPAAFLQMNMTAEQYPILPMGGFMTTPPPSPMYMYRYLMLKQQLAAMSPPSPPPMVYEGCGALGAFFFKYDMVEKPLMMQNNGHGISIDLKGHGLGSIVWDGFQFDVLSINFHAQSEHTFHGQELPLELHIVHREPETNHILVVAVPFDYAPGSAPHLHTSGFLQMKQRGGKRRGFLQSDPDDPAPPPPALDPLGEQQRVDPHVIADAAGLSPEEEQQIAPLNGAVAGHANSNEAGYSKVLRNLYGGHGNLPIPQEGQTKSIPLVDGPVDILTPLMSGLGPDPESFFQYAGSLTAPPCSEQVTWLVRKTPLYATHAQIEYFRIPIMEANSNAGNNRAPMPLMGRQILYRVGINGEPPPPPQRPNDPSMGPPADIHVDFRGISTGREAYAKSVEVAQSGDAIASSIAQAQNAGWSAAQAIDPVVAHIAGLVPAMARTGGYGAMTTPLPTPNPERVLSRIVDSLAYQLEGPEKNSVLAAAGVAFAAPPPPVIAAAPPPLIVR